VFDLGAYLERIGAEDATDLAAVHRAHVTAIPFENLDPRAGKAVSLAPDDLAAKLVTARRGGYCFEQNLLLRHALEALGHEVDVFLARVRYGAPPGTVRPRAHAVLRVRDENGRLWHADVGFGLGSPLEPLPWGPGGGEQEQEGWRFRVVEEAPATLVLQTAGAGEEWQDVYAFPEEPVPGVDLEMSNWFVSTNPTSPFVTGLIVVKHDADGTRTALSDWSGTMTLTRRSARESESEEVAPGDVPGLLAGTFGLP
jgi:N-hydroxyarylamine O-acetyltransferase